VQSIIHAMRTLNDDRVQISSKRVLRQLARNPIILRYLNKENVKVYTKGSSS